MSQRFEFTSRNKALKMSSYCSDIEKISNISIKIKGEYAFIVPALSDAEYKSLKASINEKGQLVKIDVNKQGIILDGHHRYKACKELEIVPEITVKDFENPLFEKLFIIETNGTRRQLTPFQRIELQFKLESIEIELAKKRLSEAGKSGAAKRWERELCYKNEDGVVRNHTTPSEESTQQKSKQRGGRVIDISAKKAHVSPMTYYKGREIIKQAPPQEVIDKLRNGKIKIEKVFKQLENQKKKQDVLNEIPSSAIEPPDRVKLIEGDFIECVKEIPNDNIDLIFTDPPYEKQYIYLYEQLADVAARLLKPGGNLFAIIGHIRLPEFLEAMLGSGLRYQWLFAIKHGGRHKPIHRIHVNALWKPMLWFSKGEKVSTTRYLSDFIQSRPPEKVLHKWEQSTVESEYIIKNVTQEHQIVFDPFMGAGTTGVAAVKLRRRFIGIDKDHEAVEAARANIAKHRCLILPQEVSL